MNLPNREAMIQFRHPNMEWRNSLDMDPVQLPVEATPFGLLVDVFDANLLGLVDLLCALDNGPTEYRLVWSDGEDDVRGMCPLCHMPFPVAEGAPGDIHNEGVNAVTCGCYDG